MYNVPIGLRHSPSPSPIKMTMDKQRRKTIALQSSLINVNANKRQLQLQISRLRQQAILHAAAKQKLNKKEQDILFYEESLELIRKDMQNLNAVIYQKNKQYLRTNDQLIRMRNLNSQLEMQQQKMAGTLELLAQEISKLLININVQGADVQMDLISQFRSDCKEIVRVFDNMQADVIQLLKINDSIRAQNSVVLQMQRQKIVKLQYQKRLVQQRLFDQRKRKQHTFNQQKQAKVHALQVQLLKQQQQSQRKLFNMSQMKTSQSSRISDLNAEKQNSLMDQIYTLVRRNKQLQKEKRQAKIELDKLKSSYKQVIDKYSKMNLQVENTNSNEQLIYMKNIRRIQQEKKILQIRIDELVFRNKALEDELQVYREQQ